MANGQPRGPRATARKDDEPAYEGAPGQTRREPIHVPLDNGFVRTIQVYCTVNVGTDPQLREPALADTLHRFDSGERLAVPFVYHDPAEQKMALVVPDVRRHEELALRAKFLQDIAEHAEVAVPSYVAEATSVLGVDGLRAYLARPNGPRATAAMIEQQQAAEKQLLERQRSVEQQAQDVAIQSDALSQREARLKGRAEEVTRREDELRMYGEELEMGRADLAMRENELEARFEALAQRETELASRSESLSLAAVDAVQDEIGTDSAVLKTEATQMVNASELVETASLVDSSELADAELVDELDEGELDAADLVDEEELVEEIEEIEPIETNPAAAVPSAAPPAPSRPPSSANLRIPGPGAGLGKMHPSSRPPPPGSIPPPSAPPSRPQQLSGVEEIAPLDASALVEDDLEDDVEMIPEAASPNLVNPEDVVQEIEDDDVEELDEIIPIGDVTGLHAEPEPPPESTPAAPTGPVPSVAPPRGFLDPQSPEATAVTDAGGVRMFVRLPADDDDLFESAMPDLLAQLVVIEECPVVLLTLVEAESTRPKVIRAALDPRSADDRSVLENLRRTFAARIGLFAHSGEYLRAIEVSAPREVNVAQIMDRVGKLPRKGGLDIDTAMERVRSAPPPVKADNHPFVEASALKKPRRAVEAFNRLEGLGAWQAEGKMDHASLVLSIPHDRIEGAARTVLEHALSFGLPFPGALHARALSLGLAADGATLVGQQIEAFKGTVKPLGRGGLSKEQAADAWELLLQRSTEEEFAIDTDTHEIAWKAIRAVRGGDESLENIDASKLPEMEDSALVMLLEHPRFRRDAALELAGRGDPAHSDVLCKSVRKMPRAEVVRVAPQLLKLGEDAGDALIDGLTARKTFVRQAFALVLAQLKLRRAVVPLLHLLTDEESEVWQEIARVLGSFGTASLRTVSRQLKDPKGKEERFILTLAHLANQGCNKQVDKLTSDDRPSVATMAIEALTMRDRARVLSEQVRGKVPLADNSPILKFSHRFYAELEGKAPGDDLEDA